MTETIRLATRGSDLALRQAQRVADALDSRRRTVELVEVETTGDAVRDELIHRLGKTGAFVRSLDEKVIDGDVDAAVHSMKDMPTEFPDELVVAGVPERASPGDVLVTPDGDTLDSLPDGATVGTSSLRRKAQLLAARPDLDVQPLRGNVDTRVQKLLAPSLQAEHERRLEAEDDEGEAEDEDGDDADRYDRPPEEWFDDLAEIERQALGREIETRFDGIVLAEAGLQRTGLLAQVETERLPETFVPAAGQGALAVTACDGDVGQTLQNELDHPRTRVETTVERTILGTLGGGCVAPVGIHAVVRGEYVQASVRVLSQDGTEEIEATRDLPIERHPEAAREFADELADRGAADLIQRARRDA
ncbi:hydroxymethylbilane synthase (porphobilinogen deaminase) [Natronomonas pharaonis DSM 2160]|uniref:Hydroxymethylbilane synthase n=1 Tax=Natronomonas pharaonis (strain ATCC 35678 / DSM 2160 / CIP 103997 / JCM 8858 / NBRC 14720 / NCIMB 2260 / Gabara) TaxID=348780 RepID=A0A1U7EUV4_NATPD|nr:hydroxymethylbilane synthase [Natronomonas pharaonis]CAI48754.1 hydroxymethylbilane synthase (porphobilinogen deaminase) [Natronomonas pharaonis DSM 2160]